MGYRCRIAASQTNGMIRSVYCHAGANLLPILRANYSTVVAVEALINLGDLSCVGKEIGSAHAFGNPNPDWCLDYGRDRGEKKVGFKWANSHAALAQQCDNCDADALYLFDEGTSEWSETKRAGW